MGKTILLGLPEDIYAAIDSCETTQEIWLRVQQMMKGSDIGIQEKKAKLFNEWESHNGVDMLPSFIRLRTCTQLITLNYLTTAMNMALLLMAKAFKLNYSTPTNNNQRISSNPRNRQIAQPGNLNGYNVVQNVGNQRISSNPRNRQIAQPGMNMGQDRQMQMVGGNGGNQFRQYAGQNARNPAGNQNQIENGNLVAARAEGNAARQNGNQIRCYNCRGIGHYARNCTARPRKRDAAYLQTQLLIAQKEEAGIQLQAEEYDLMAAAADLDDIDEVNANCILMANLQQASTSGTQSDSTPVYDTDGSIEVHKNYDDNEIFNMFTQEEQVEPEELNRK
nr:hypothetical protein [Tanacetum cinerariifolium]